ncbi:hypothetical protein WA026_010316 [Henosepilachna vigintioctopunctata]|uniref:Ubiquitin-like domain-containing protein n=1 Tax=Henosepilachna vigintioctopunctata TaxID=420089 RepID=A0AAW1VD19_9CUCU
MMFVCAWLDKFQRIKINNVKPNEKVADLKNHVLTVIDKNLQNIVFIYRGSILSDDNKCLTDYEVTENSVIHVMELTSSDSFSNSPECTAKDFQDTVSSFRALTKNAGFRSNVQALELCKIDQNIIL